MRAFSPKTYCPTAAVGPLWRVALAFVATFPPLLLFIAALAASPVARAQSPAKIPRVGVLSERGPTDPFLVAFRQGLQEAGYVEGRNIAIEYRYAAGVIGRSADLIAELLRLDVDVLVVGGATATRAAKSATTTVPIVFSLVGDPVGYGLVTSLARPGGNATGLSNLVTPLSGKQLELLKAAVPRLSRVVVLHNPLNSGAALTATREAARALAIELLVLEVRQPDDLAGVFAKLTATRAGAVLALSDPVFGNESALAKLAGEARLPAMYSRREFAEAGGLMAYGPNFSDNYRRAATYVDRILKGARPGDLPVEQPTKFEFVINLRTAKTLGLAIPPSLLQRADQVLE